jgi:uncharacterized lipoprotein YddW (UPF0748 family)
MHHLITAVVMTVVVWTGWAQAQPARATQPAPKEVRAIWVTRWDYKQPEDVRRIVANCARMNFNVILFQVRGNATVFYRSEVEPWAWELTSEGPETTGQDPGWDPLAVAISEARRRGVELHAWVNVFPAWHSQNFPPEDSGQLWWTRPEWFMHDAAENRMIPRDAERDPNVRRDWYSFISPGVPEVQDYLAELMEELVRNYEIDGLHYDYVRYPAEIREVAEGYEERVRRLGNWSYDPVSLRRFSEETGVAAPDDDPEKWVEWRNEQVTATVRQIHERVRAHRPELIISAAVVADPADARATKYQDYVHWMEQGYIDAAIPMNYTGDNDLFRQRTQMLLDRRPARGYVLPGMSLGHAVERVQEQIGIVRELPVDGFSGFAYSHLFDRDNRHVPKPPVQELARTVMRQKAAVSWRDAPAEAERP